MRPLRDVVEETPPGLRGEVKGRQANAKGLDAPGELGIPQVALGLA